jgi:hypothetical protein
MKFTGSANKVDLSAPVNVPSQQNVDGTQAASASAEEAPRIARSAQNAENPFARPAPRELYGRMVYKRYSSTANSYKGELHDLANMGNVCKLVSAIAQVEAPILYDALCLKVASFWGLQRAGSRVRNVVMRTAEQCALVMCEANGRQFLWTQELLEQSYEIFRVPDDGDPNPRPAQEICPEEIANAAAQLLAQHISMNVDDLIRETATIFGIKRLGTNVRIWIEDGITLMKEQKRCRIDGTTLVVN